MSSSVKPQTDCDAIEQAKELQPDLILLDLSLPKLNGMEAARRIRKLCPHSKIIFLSQDHSPEIVQGALRLGAAGYLLKSDATELPLAVDAILQGKVFVSRRVKALNSCQPYPRLLASPQRDTFPEAASSLRSIANPPYNCDGSDNWRKIAITLIDPAQPARQSGQ